MKKLLKIKTLAICAILLAGIIFPTILTAQRNDGFFKSGEDDYENRIANQVLTNQSFGNEPAPLGSGLLLLSVAGAGYAIARHRRVVKKSTTMLLALSLLFCLPQCKKRIESVVTDGNTVHITLNVNSGTKHQITFNDTYAPVSYENGDKIYVGNNGKYIGTLTCQSDGSFSGDISTPSTSDFLHFYFVGKCNSGSLTPGATESFIIDISNQKTSLPVISYAHTAEKYYGETIYSCKLENKCALVEFKTPIQTHKDLYMRISNMFTEVKIDFTNPGIITPTGKLDAITLYTPNQGYPTSRWAIILSGQSSRNSVAIVQENIDKDNTRVNYYDILKNNTIADIPALEDNQYFHDGTAFTVNNANVTNKKLFVVSDNGNVVQFSSGNLQYRASEQKWRFATNPWDVVGNNQRGNVYEIIDNVNTKCNNANIKEDYQGWIDLFGWGTWGEGKNPCSISTDNNYYTWSTDFKGTIDGFDDWRVLTKEEWIKLQSIHYDPPYEYGVTGYKFGKGKVTNADYANPSTTPPTTPPKGVIIEPINSTIPNLKRIGVVSDFNEFMSGDDWNNNYANYGAVFLPYPSGRNGATMWNNNYINTRGYYWSSTPDDTNGKACYGQPSDNLGLNNGAYYKCYGLSVRLVR